MLPFIARAFDDLRISMTREELLAPEASSQAQKTAPSGKKKNKKKNAKKTAPPRPDQPITQSTPTPSSDSNEKKKKKKKAKALVRRFETYFGSGALSDWQRLCQDVGLEGEYPSKMHCEKALRTVYINIDDLLEAVKAGKQVRRFKNESALAKYCQRTGKIYPKEKAKESGPVKHLLRHVL